MKTKNQELKSELASIKKRLYGQTIYYAYPKGYPGPKYVRTTTRGNITETIAISKEEFDAASRLEDESYSIRGLSPKLLELGALNFSYYMSDIQWIALVDAVLNRSIEISKDLDSNTYRYMKSLSKPALNTFISTVNIERDTKKRLLDTSNTVINKVISNNINSIPPNKDKGKYNTTTSPSSLLVSNEESQDARVEHISKMVSIDFPPEWPTLKDYPNLW